MKTILNLAISRAQFRANGSINRAHRQANFRNPKWFGRNIKRDQLATNIHTPENKTVADNPSCHNNDPARDNPRIRQRSNSTKSQERARERKTEREENRIIPRTIYWISQIPRALSVIRGRSSITFGEPVNRAKSPSDAVSRLFRLQITKESECLKKLLINWKINITKIDYFSDYT